MGEDYLKYQLKPGDGVGSVLRKLHLLPIWTSNGYLKKTALVNPKLHKKYPLLKLPVWTWINLPVTSLPESSEYSIVNNEVTFSKKGQRNSASVIETQTKSSKKIELSNRNMGDIVIHFNKGSIPPSSKDNPPVIVNVNITNEGTHPYNRRSGFDTSSIQVKEPSFLSRIKSHQLALQLGTHSFRLDTKNKSSSNKSVILSDSEFSLNSEWKVLWGEYLSAALGFQISQFEITDISGNSLIEEESKTLMEFSIQSAYKFLDNLNLTMGFEYGEKYFSNSETGSLLLTPVYTPSFNFGAEYVLARWEKQNLTLALDFIYDLGTSDFEEIESGVGYQGAIEYETIFGKRHSIGGLLSYSSEIQATETVEQTNSDLGFFIYYRNWFGGDE